MIFYLLVAVTFGAHLACCDKFDRPVLLNSFNMFSTFYLSLLFWLFCFDLSTDDKLYFFSQNFQMLFVFFVICALVCSRDYLYAKNIIKYEYDLLFIFVVLSAVCLCFCNEFLLIYLAIELQSLTLYIFATFNRNSEFSTEAGLKYFVFGGLMSCFLLLGLSIIYLYFGSISFELMASLINFNPEPLFFSGFLFVLIVFLFKVGSAPFHFWLCDVYEGSVLSVTMLFASAPKIILFGLLFKLCFFVLYDYNTLWSIIIGASAVSSIIIGSISAIYQKRVKRLFAYSTIAHTGFILLAFLACSLESAKALIFYIIIYSSLTIALFAILINASVGTAVQPKYLINMSSIGSKNHIFAVSFCLIILAIAGIPPLAGFFSKFFILLSLIGAKYYFISLIVILFSSIACFYYIRLVKIVFFVKESKNSMWITNNSKQNSEILVGLFLFVIICYFIHPNLLVDLSIVVGLTLF
jgi:NADH-quinone oxidoreductase subunit N